MRYENKKWHREGQFFVNPKTSMNLESVRVLHAGVDTVKELFKCLLDIELITKITNFYENSIDGIMEVGGYPWIVTRSSQKSGYQWILRNADIGLVVLLKSFYTDITLHGSHIKIEGSPHLINSMNPEDYSAFTLKIARLFATQVQATGCAAHLAVDLKGWEVPPDFEYALVTRAKRKMQFSGISKMEVELAETSAIYGDRQTFTFGSASSLQLCVYDKVTEAIKSDKIDYWESIWSKIPAADIAENHDFPSEYQQGDKVIRIEGRLHHSVVQQFCNATRDENGDFILIRNFQELSRYLTALWRYILNNFRLQQSSSYVHPLWQLLEEDVIFYAPSPEFEFKRGQKQPNDNTNRKMGIWLGNTVRLYSRKRFKTNVIVNLILKCGFENELCSYFGLWDWEDKNHLHSVLTDFVSNKKRLLTLQGIAA